MKLKDIGKIVTGKTPSTKQLENFSGLDDKYLFVTPRDMKDNCKYIESTERYLTSFVEDKFKSQIIKKDSVCISCIGSDMGKVYMINRPGITNQQINSITDIKDICNPHYLYYYFSDKKEYLKGIAGGSTMPILNKSTFENIEIDLPARNIQDKIVKILSNIDNKIELNNQTNDNLSEIIKTQYDKFINDIDEYELVKLTDLANVSSGKRPKIKGNEFNIPLIGASGVMAYTDNYNFNEDILIIGRVGTLGVVQRYFDKIWASDNTLIIKTEYSSAVECYLKTVDYISLNRGSTQPLITQTDISNLKIKFNKVKFEEFEKKIRPLRDKIYKNELQNKTLEQLRDILLPKLMNGEIDLDKIKI